MFDCHQAEITVMQFTGDSLPVHHSSGTVGPSPCPILSAEFTCVISFRLMAIGMCHFRYLWNGMFARAEGQSTTPERTEVSSIWVLVTHNKRRARVQDCWRRLLRKEKEYLPRDSYCSWSTSADTTVYERLYQAWNENHWYLRNLKKKLIPCVFFCCWGGIPSTPLFFHIPFPRVFKILLINFLKWMKPSHGPFFFFFFKFPL